MSIQRMAVAALLSGVIVFVWGFLSHAVLTVGVQGIENLPSEAALLPAMKLAIPAPGMYRFPGMDEKDTSDAAQQQWLERANKGPTGLLIIHPSGRTLNMATLLVTEFVTNLLGAALLTIVLCRVNGGRLTRTMFGAAMGLFAWLAIDASDWNWDGFSGVFASGQCIDQTVSGLLAGFTDSNGSRLR